ncbi:MAG: acyl-CoA thioesterase [Myxococcales bacterium]|nr:acyl-CoA thioesterase [Myxococcales bacterium]
MLTIERQVRFEEVDAAGILFFARYATYAHDAMERLFDGLAGGYVALTMKRRIGMPAVRLNCQFSAPLRYGDIACITVSTTRIGNRSVELGYRIVRKHDGVLAATLGHTVVTTDLDRLRSCDMPADVRALLTAHLDAAAP